MKKTLLTTNKVSDEAATWLLAQLDEMVTLVLRWSSDLSREDAEDIVQSLFTRICRRGIVASIGDLERHYLIFHLRRELATYIKRRNRDKRQGKAIHLGWCLMAGHENEIQAGGMMGQRHQNAILIRDDYRLLDDFLQILVLDTKGRLRVLVLVMRRIMDSYERPRDLFEEMTDAEKVAFHPTDGRVLTDGELETFIMTAIERTLEKLRARLRELRDKIPMN